MLFGPQARLLAPEKSVDSTAYGINQAQPLGLAWKGEGSGLLGGRGEEATLPRMTHQPPSSCLPREVSGSTSLADPCLPPLPGCRGGCESPEVNDRGSGEHCVLCMMAFCHGGFLPHCWERVYFRVSLLPFVPGRERWRAGRGEDEPRMLPPPAVPEANSFLVSAAAHCWWNGFVEVAFYSLFL